MPSKTKNSFALGAVLITGGAKRIGRTIALHLARQGYSIALHYNSSRNDAANLTQEISELGVRCDVFKAELTDAKSVAALIPAVLKKLPDLRFLINNAAIFEKSTLKDLDIKDFDRELAINLRAPFILTSQFARYIKEGAVINILDTNVTKDKTGHISYLLAKKGLSEMTRIAAVELAPDIRVNGIAPGLILPPEAKGKDYLDRLVKNVPLRRKGEPEDVACAIQFLLENTYITGQTIFVDGGEHLKK